jgi:hypothetical protein
MRKQLVEIVLRDFPNAGELIDCGLISERRAEMYAVKRRYEEIKPDFEFIRDACEKLEKEFPKSDKTIYKYIRSIVVK